MTGAGIDKANTDIASVSVGTVHALPQRIRDVNLTCLQGRRCFSLPLFSRYVLLAFWFTMTGLEVPPTTEYCWLELP